MFSDHWQSACVHLHQHIIPPPASRSRPPPAACHLPPATRLQFRRLPSVLPPAFGSAARPPPAAPAWRDIRSCAPLFWLWQIQAHGSLMLPRAGEVMEILEEDSDVESDLLYHICPRPKCNRSSDASKPVSKRASSPTPIDGTKFSQKDPWACVDGVSTKMMMA
ncbi:hypothetical protein GGX14DRAFT_575882 [Mycena pura]|uniref:Uncharacterized protein n=1 Tax=Mycena pura TaxID=153505 RepID=A0AAD6Y7R7_9AGAR|nr:hypothetical protein GGX14DRAFT_575882 [Mycena pura]